MLQHTQNPAVAGQLFLLASVAHSPRLWCVTAHVWHRADAEIHGFGSDPLLSANCVLKFIWPVKQSMCFGNPLLPASTLTNVLQHL